MLFVLGMSFVVVFYSYNVFPLRKESKAAIIYASLTDTGWFNKDYFVLLLIETSKHHRTI
jgi:hypothetical protein